MAHRAYPPYNLIATGNFVASRLYNTTYLNTTGRTMWVVVLSLHAVTVAGGTAITNYMTSGLGVMGISGINAAPISSIYTTTTFPVLPGTNYRVNSIVINGTNTLQGWSEFY